MRSVRTYAVIVAAVGLLLAAFPAWGQSKSYAWKLLAPLGLREPAPMDTLPLNYYRESIPSLVSDAYATTGNLGGAGLNMIFDKRPEMSDFFFADGIRHWMPTHDKMRFYNTRIPMTLLAYNTAGTKVNTQDRLNAIFSGNINPKAQVGAMMDFLYSKGCYDYQAVKDLSWGASGSYMGDRYEMQAYYNNFNMLNKESGGITNMLYITDPAELQGGINTIDPKSIPTQLKNAHTRMRGQELYINNRYKVGFWRETPVIDPEDPDNDSTTVREYVPVTSFIYTLRYRDGNHRFIDKSPSEIRKFFANTYLNPDITDDYTKYSAFENTVGVSLMEGFHRYAKFGLAAYLTYELRRYRQTADTLDRTLPELDLTPLPEGTEGMRRTTTQNLLWVGAQLTKQRGSLLRYEATAELGIGGAVAGEVKVDGRVETRFPFLRDSLEVAAYGSFRNTAPPFLSEEYLSNHFIWHNDFGFTRRATIGGSIDLGRSDTHLRATVSNIQNHIYFGADGLPVQHGGSVQVLTVGLQQNIHAGIWHWDNSVTYQHTSNDRVIPLPMLAVYSNMYLHFRIATLRVQLGADCDYYTSYYAPGFQPATVQFVNQREMKLGNYPFCSVYANMKLSKVRFYVMYSHFNEGLFGGSRYFSMPYYPLNPARFQLGLSIDFAN